MSLSTVSKAEIFTAAMDPAKPPGNETSYVWEIENFSMCPQSKEECLKSTTFFVDSMDVSEYQLVLYPRGRLSDSNDTAMCLLECRQESDFHLNVTITITYEDEHIEKKKENVLLNTGETIGIPVELRKKDLEPGKFALLPGELFIVRCTITPLYKDPQADDVDLKTLSEDLGRFLQMGLFSDFCLITQDKRNFPVHKVILTIRCRQLAEKVGIFENEDCEEGLVGDVTGEAMGVFLHYVYTGRLRENLLPELLNEIYTMADQFGMDDLKRDLFPLELCTVGRTIVKVDHHDITWDLVDFHDRVEAGDWPVQTFLDLVIGRFVASFSIIEDETGETKAQVDLQCQCLNLDRALTMKCVVKVFTPDEESREILCKGEHRFETTNLDQLFVMRGDYAALYKYRSVKEFPDRVALVFDFKVSHPRYFNRCNKMEVVNALYTPHPFCKRSLYRLSSDMDIVYKDTVEEGDKSDSDDDESFFYSDMKVMVTAGGKQGPIPAHRCILSARSSHLMSMIMGNEFSADQTIEIPMPNMRHVNVLQTLRYVYSGKFPEEISMHDIMEVYMNARDYQMKTLSARCLQLFRLKAQLKDLIMLVLLSEDLDDDQLMLAVASFIRRRKDAVLNSKEWAEVVKRAPNRATLTLNFANSRMEF